MWCPFVPKAIFFSAIYAWFIGRLVNGETQEMSLEEFKVKISQSKYKLVKFYAPWCGHCKALAPEFEDASKKIQEAPIGKEVSLMKVDCTVETTICGHYGIKGYPTLYWFLNGTHENYEGGRTSASIFDWVNSMTGSAIKEVSEGSHPPEPKGFKPVFTIYGSHLNDVIQGVANKNRLSAEWYFVKEKSASSLKLVLKHRNEDPIEIADEATLSDAAALEKAVKKRFFPLFGVIDQQTYGKYVQAADGIGMLWVLFNISSSEEVEQTRKDQAPKMLQVATAIHDIYRVVYTDTHMFRSQLEQMFGVKELPAVVLQKDPTEKAKWVYTGDMTSEKIIQYVMDVEAGRILPSYKSEEPVEETINAANNVRVVVGKTLVDEVMGGPNSKHPQADVVLEIYAPWCGHCKNLEPHYESVAKKIKEKNLQDLVVVTKMDGNANDSPVPEIDFKGFPTIVYVPATPTGTPRHPIYYSGERTAKDIWKWIKANHSRKDELLSRIKEVTASGKEDDAAEKKPAAANETAASPDVESRDEL